MRVRTVRIVLEVTVPTDREGWEYGDNLARYLSAEINDEDGAPFGPASVECVDVEEDVP